MRAELLARLWLNEPDRGVLGQAEGIWGEALPSAAPGELAAAWTDLFLLNVYPYGSVYTDPSGELQADSAGSLAFSYEARGYAPPELSEAGAPDHVGLVLGFTGHLRQRGIEDPGFLAWMTGWLPVCALAVERQPWAHPFYRALARITREWVLDQASRTTLPIPPETPAGSPEPLDPASEEEVGLSDVVSYLLAPARCGFFLSRAKMGEFARSAGLRLPFGSRFDVARALFSAAAEGGALASVIGSLERERAAWEGAIAGFALDHSAWRCAAAIWLARLEGTKSRLTGMVALLNEPLDLEYGEKVGGQREGTSS